MIQKYIELFLPEGVFYSNVDYFEDCDKTQIKNMIMIWNQLSSLLKKMNYRGINIPEGISEPLFCLSMRPYYQAVRIKQTIKGANTSFDCYNVDLKLRIQVKACSVLPDLSSFGPTSQFDQLIFLDLSTICIDGEFKIFDIPLEFVYNHKVNKIETFIEQQNQGRRPRFSLYNDIIKVHQIMPFYIGNINEW